MITYYEPPDDGDTQGVDASGPELPSAAWMGLVSLLSGVLLLGGALLGT